MPKISFDYDGVLTTENGNNFLNAKFLKVLMFI
jgi:hypothetical protein